MKRKLPLIVVPIKEKVSTVMKDNADLITEYITFAIKDGIDNKLTSVDVFKVKFEIGLPGTEFKLDRSKWAKFLTDMMQKSVQFEHYEKAAEYRNMLANLESD